jgi:uncharacterized protein
VLEVTFYRDARDRVSEFSAHGHAEFDIHGKDIVCAAVSAILQAARVGLTEYARAGVAAQQAPGWLDIHVQDDDRDAESVRSILATAELAIEQISQRYPKHVRLRRVTEIADRRRTRDV